MYPVLVGSLLPCLVVATIYVVRRYFRQQPILSISQTNRYYVIIPNPSMAHLLTKAVLLRVEAPLPEGWRYLEHGGAGIVTYSGKPGVGLSLADGDKVKQKANEQAFAVTRDVYCEQYRVCSCRRWWYCSIAMSETARVGVAKTFDNFEEAEKWANKETDNLPSCLEDGR